MKIKKLEIYGFKTFPKPTELIFHEGITGIVGPNGCGKSNIIDAMRWVMGEKSAKGLRGGSMGDVIFSGCESRKPLGFAEVTLTLSEVEGSLPEKFGTYHEISVTRRLHRSGESEYLINKIPCRLRDITDLFLDTGLGKRAYSIVEQGRIDAILSAKPQERRYLIEEAAGLSKYRSRRDEALNKMKHTRENLDRLNDIIAEVRREMNSLKRQAGRARAFKELRAKKRELERYTMISSWVELSARLGEARAAADEAREVLAGARAEAEKLNTDLETGRLTLLTSEKKHEEVRKVLYSIKNQISERENRKLFLEKEAQSLLERSRRAQLESNELDERAVKIGAEIELLENDMEEIAARLATDDENLAALQERLAEAVKAKRAVEERIAAEKEESFSIMARLSTVNNNIDHAMRRERESARRLEELERSGEDLAEKLAEVTSETDRHVSDLDFAKSAHARAIEEQATLAEDMEDMRLDREKLAARVDELRAALQSTESRLEGLTQLKENLEFYGSGVKAFLKHAKDERVIGVRGVLADAISVPGKYESALESALGECLQYVVVADAEQAAEGVAYLKEKGAGRSTFAPVELRQPEPPIMPEVSEAWAHGPLIDLVKVEPGMVNLARILLGSFYVVDNLDFAKELWRREDIRATFVTLEGDTLTPEGVISGGSAGKAGGLLSRNRQIRELEEEVARRRLELEEESSRLEEMTEGLRHHERRLELLKNEAHQQELRIAHVSRDMAQYEERRERLQERLDTLDFEREDISAESARLKRELTALEEEKRSLTLSKEEFDDRRETLDEEREEREEQLAEAQSMVAEARVRSEGDRQRAKGISEQIRTLTAATGANAERALRLKKEGEALLKEHEARLAEGEKLSLEHEVLVVELGRKEEESEHLLSELEGSRDSLSEREKAAMDARRRAEKIQETLTEAQLSQKDVEMKVDMLRERYAESAGQEEAPPLESLTSDALPEGYDGEKTREEVESLSLKLSSFGELNLLADTEYEERKERFDFLEEQRGDLEESLDSLKRAISRINRISRERFQQTFDEVNEQFKAVFPRLFRGGSAELFLTDPEDMLETGIDVIVHPPGKKPQHISLLSGGEKALTAVAIIFSLFLVKPSPFCILDEVDAPLDDANVERFTEMLAEMATATQFLVITHNKISMEVANHLYGVTMEEPGVTDMVSVRLSSHLSSVEAA